MPEPVSNPFEADSSSNSESNPFKTSIISKSDEQIPNQLQHHNEVSQSFQENESTEQKSVAADEENIQDFTKLTLSWMEVEVDPQQSIHLPMKFDQLETFFEPVGLKSHPELLDQFFLMNSELNILREIKPFFLSSLANSELVDYLSEHYDSRVEFVMTRSKLDELKSTISNFTKSFWIFSTKVLTDSQSCRDKRTVTLSHEYEYADFSENTFHTFQDHWESLKLTLTVQLSRVHFENQLSWVKIEKHLNSFLVSFVAVEKPDLNVSYPSFRFRPHHSKEVAEMHRVLCVLFSFLRRPQPDKVFTEQLRNWVHKCCAVFLRCSTLYDHLMILNHVLRLPATICNEDFIRLVHLPSISSATSVLHESTIVALDHTLVVAKFVMTAVPQRMAFLKELEKAPDVGMNADKDGKSNWILLEDSGEESECPESSWYMFSEENLTGFIERLPLEKILKNLTLMLSNRDAFLQTVAYFNHLLNVFSECFQSYTLERFGSLRKLVASYSVAICNFTINAYLVNFHKSNQPIEPEVQTLKTEVEALLMRAFSLLSWNIDDKNVFPAIQNFNFAILTPNSTWKLAYILLGPQENVCIEDLLQFAGDPKDMFLDGLNNFSNLDQKLQRCFFVCGAALLSTLTNMVSDCSFRDQELLVFIMNALFYVSYVSPQHKENYFKFGHNLVSYLLTSHLELVTFYLNKVNRNWEKMLSDINLSYLLDISLEQWVPSNSDIELLLHWLEYYDIQHALNILARKVLSFIDWLLTDDSGQGCIPIVIQKRVLSTIIHIYNSVVSSELSEVSPDVKLVQTSATLQQVFANPVQSFSSWCWKMVSVMQVKGDVLASRAEELKNESLKKVPGNGYFLASYAALNSSDSSNHQYSLSNGGLTMLRQLAVNGFLKCSIHLLDAKLKFELSNLDILFQQKSDFAVILAYICQGDSSLSHKIGLSAETGPNTELLSAMLVSLLQSVESSHKTHAKYLLEFLLSVILSYPNLYSNYHLLFLLEQICFFAFSSKSLWECARLTFLRHLEELQKTDPSKSFRLFSSTKYFTPLQCIKTYRDLGFVSYFSLVAQINFEDQNGVWSPLVEKMNQESQATPASVLKGLQADEKWNFTFAETSLSIYLLVEVLMLVEPKHLAFPLLSQLFFARFFARPGKVLGQAASSSVGERFFSSYYYMGTMKRLKQRFEESASLWRALESSKSEKNDGENEAESDFENIVAASSSYDMRCVVTGKDAIARHMDAFSLWIDEPKLHSASLIIHNLPDTYLPQSLTGVMSLGTKPLEAFMTEIQLQSDVIRCMKVWHDELYSNFKKPVVVIENFDFSVEAAKYRMERARSKFSFRELTIPDVKASVVPLSTVDTQLLISNRNLLEFFGKSFNNLTSFSQKQVVNWKELTTDFEKYLELTPQQFENKLTTLQKVLNCESMLQRQRCTGPVVFDLSYSCKSENLAVSFELERIWKKIMESVVNDVEYPIETISAVHVMEEVVEKLVQLAESNTSSSTDRHVATSNSLDLFFLIANIVSQDVLSFPPFRKITEILFTSLGSKFVSNSGESQSQLLDLLLTKPFLVPILNAYFCPQLASGKFCAFYQKLSSRLICNFDKVYSELLLTKFDFASWLAKTSNASLRSTVLACVFDLLGFAGKDVKHDRMWTFTCAKGQAFHFLSNDFVVEFPTFFMNLINLSMTGKASMLIWEDLLDFCGMEYFSLFLEDPEKTRSKFSSSGKTYSLIQHFNSCDFISNISSLFQQMRLNNFENAPVKLFDDYMEPISKFLVFLSSIVTHTTYKQTSSGALAPSEAGMAVWNHVTNLYSPFIASHTHEGKLQLPKPVDQSDQQTLDLNFDRVCHAFTVSILDALNNEAPSCNSSLSAPSYLHHFLSYFNHVLCQSNQYNKVMNHYFKAFLNLPWTTFVPHIQSVDVLMLIRQQTHVDPKEFALQVFLSVDWNTYCKLHCELDEQIANTALHRFLLFSVLLETDDALSESSSALIVTKLDKIRDVNWRPMCAEYLTIILSVFLKFYYKKQSLSLKDPFGSFRLILEATGLTREEKESDCAVEEHVSESSFEHKSTFMELVSARVLRVTSSETVAEIVQTLLTFVSCSMDPMSHSASAIINLFTPVVKLVNSLTYDQQIGIALQGFKNWVARPKSREFLPLAVVSLCQNMASVETLAYFSESSLEAYFKRIHGPAHTHWETMCNSLDIPSSGKAEFLSVCSKKCFYFVLEIVSRTERFSSPEGKLTQLFTWLNDSKGLSSENEAKAFLLFRGCFEGLEKVLTTAPSVKFIELARNFSTYLSELSEERDSSGLRGMIGLGAASKLSLTFRICCKCLMCFLQIQIEQIGPSNADSSKKTESAAVLRNALKGYSVVKDYPEVAAKLQPILESELELDVPMENWRELVFDLVSCFYSEDYGIKVLSP